MKPKIKEIWSCKSNEYLELRFDWDNGWHNAVVIDPPYDKESVIRALEYASYLLRTESAC